MAWKLKNYWNTNDDVVFHALQKFMSVAMGQLRIWRKMGYNVGLSCQSGFGHFGIAVNPSLTRSSG
jgi:hypothetical protein